MFVPNVELIAGNWGCLSPPVYEHGCFRVPTKWQWHYCLHDSCIQCNNCM